MSFLEGLAVATILAAPAVLVARAISRVPRQAEHGTASPGPDRHDIDSWPGVGPLAEPPPKPVIHYWPALGSERLDCCGEDPFAPGQSLTIDPRRVTCEGMRVPGRAER